MAQPVGYSDLEVRRGPQILGQTYSTLQATQPDLSLADSQKQLAADPEKQLARHFDPYGASAPETVVGHRLYPSKSGPSPNGTILGLRWRTFWITLVLSLVVIAAIVGGAVGGTVGKSQNNEGTSSPTSSPPDSEAASLVSPPPSASRLLQSTTVSSVAWNDTQGTLQQRLYIQASDNNIWELSWNATASTWFTSSENLGQAKPGSPLAAAVAYRGRTSHVKLYYINTNGELMHTNTTDFTHWDTNPVTSSTGAAIKPANDSSLAATWYNYPPCQSCSYNAFVAYQNGQTGGFEVVNASINGETQYIKLPGNPLKGSSCFFNLMWRSNQIAFLRLGYQLASGQQTGAQWNGTANAWQANETPGHHAHYSIVAPLAPMTSFSFGRGAPTEVPDYVFLLAAGEDGVSIDWWDNSDPAATVWGPPQSPAVMRGVRSLSPITANGAGHVFAFEGAVVKEFAAQPDGTTWDLVGDVTGS
ncbi:MAG: hypothetical protein Q9210_007444 [Variospora velana]